VRRRRPRGSGGREESRAREKESGRESRTEGQGEERTGEKDGEKGGKEGREESREAGSQGGGEAARHEGLEESGAESEGEERAEEKGREEAVAEVPSLEIEHSDRGVVMTGRRVLIVEDNPANLALMEYLLRAGGFSVLTASDGEAGVALALRERPDVILMDLLMPTLNGFEAFTRIRKMPELRQVVVIAVTALASASERDGILAHGFDGCIAKPITPRLSFPRSSVSSRCTAPRGLSIRLLIAARDSRTLLASLPDWSRPCGMRRSKAHGRWRERPPPSLRPYVREHGMVESYRSRCAGARFPPKSFPSSSTSARRSGFTKPRIDRVGPTTEVSRPVCTTPSCSSKPPARPADCRST
jgi:CheY-like chemotaxis protein